MAIFRFLQRTVKSAEAGGSRNGDGISGLALVGAAAIMLLCATLLFGL